MPVLTSWNRAKRAWVELTSQDVEGTSCAAVQRFPCGGGGSIPALGTKAPPAAGHRRKEKDTGVHF